jgi:hypothetical protein
MVKDYGSGDQMQLAIITGLRRGPMIETPEEDKKG